ncbi:MAG: SagB/ThcOx family dehydrogenase [bacterium]|nr:SagB/ThcOx family dehydrogenase [bacterium]
MSAREWWAATYLSGAAEPGRERGEAMPAQEWPVPEGAEVIGLPEPGVAAPGMVDFLGLVNGRRTVRTYRAEALRLGELSYLLWCTQGVQKMEAGGKTLRTVPSAGARHAFETLVLVNAVEGLEAGLYRYVASKQGLVRMEMSAERVEELTDSFRNVQLVTQSAVVFLWVAVMKRMTWRFGARGWRYILLDAGHVCQNLYLASESIGCGACAIGSFDDEGVNCALGLDGEEEFFVYGASVGRKV